MYEVPQERETTYSSWYRPSSLQNDKKRDSHRASALASLEGRTSYHDPSDYEFIRWGMEHGLDPMRPGIAEWRDDRTRNHACKVANQVRRDWAKEGYRGRSNESDSD
jgi:hypothetical protein